MAKEAYLGFRLRKTDKTINYLLEEIKHNDLITEKYKRTCKYLSYVERVVILVLAVTVCVSISAFACLCTCWYYEFCSRIKNLCNHCRNQKV